MEMLREDIPVGSCVNVHQSNMEVERKKAGHVQYFRQGNNKDINRVNII